MKETIIILGAGVMQGPAIKIAKELDFYTIVLDGSSSAPCILMADRFEKIDLKDKEGIEAFARSIQNSVSRLGIMTAGTDFSASAAWTAERLGLPGIPYEAALNASDKSRMRECFKKAALPSPDFFTISAEDIFNPRKTSPGVYLTNANNANDQAAYYSSLIADNSLAFPLVIKPVDNMGSRGCRRVNNESEFHEAAVAAVNFSRSGRAIAESYMEGPEFSADAIVYKGEITICGLADRHIFFPPYFIEMGHTMPAVIEQEKQKALLETFCSGIRALGLADKDNIGAAKGDIKLTAKGPMIGEIAARLSGGYMSGWTYPYSSGVHPVKAAVLAAMGREPDSLIPTRKWTCAERAFISIPGTVKQITINNKQRTENREHLSFCDLNLFFGGDLYGCVNDFFLRVTEGDKVSFPENNVTKCGNVIASSEDRETAVAAAETAARSVLIRLDPADEETQKFLLTETAHSLEIQGHGDNINFPPDAFQLTDELKEALAQIPDTSISNSSISNSSFLITQLKIIPFPAFINSNLRDYMGRTAEEALEAVRSLTGCSLPLINICASCEPQVSCPCESVLNPAENAENIIRPGQMSLGHSSLGQQVSLGRSFWAALIRGSYQGAVYYIDHLCNWETNDKNQRN